LAESFGSILAGLTRAYPRWWTLASQPARGPRSHGQTVASYTRRVLEAYGESEDALTDLRSLTEQVEKLDAVVRASQDYRQLADVQYQNGLLDHLIVIDAERTLLNNQLALAQANNSQMSASIHLIEALGGGWQCGGS
jgi:outer membrane protein TolC